MAVFTVSRQFGAGGRTLGKMIADRLGYVFADSEVVQRIAEAANVSPNFVETVEKESGTKISKVINSMVYKTLVERVLKSERGYIDERLYLDYLVVIIAQLAEEGNVVILGRGSQYVLNDHPDAYHILLVRDYDNRIKFVEEKYCIPHKKAVMLVNTEDRCRTNLFKKLGKTDFENPNHYHLVLNMDRISFQAALDMACKLIESPNESQVS
jgi:cytidylate kinase